MPAIKQRFNEDVIGNNHWTPAVYDTEQIIQRHPQKVGIVRVEGIARSFWGIDIISEPELTDLYCLRHLPSGRAVHTGHKNNGYTTAFLKDIAHALEGSITIDHYDIPRTMEIIQPLLDSDHRQSMERIRSY